MEPATLHTERLLLRCVTPADEASLAEACNDPLIARYVPVPSPYTAEDARRFVAASTAGWANGVQYGLGFYLAATGELVGTCVLKCLERGVVDLGYWAAPKYRRQGLTVEAARRLCQWGFDELDIHRIDWWAVVGNTGSRAVAEALGFQVEGLLRRRAYQAGEPRDWWVGGLLSRPE
ncbi:GNAT family N-acetyltransferase [Mycobacterium sp. CBMA271]|uniref:GNAT family N-acetyltransferase n=1 Tax=unclassified Mycobacteroides TaxID=2618759 RepID=UPI0012DFBBED|nr:MULTISPECIES: GNAT family protein [unclassified Mycobacteroides]MUM19211.1 GNAT family N-acetyltransferase [Mycobacteroides sp. CBMA 326]MUM21625.1 GNAT family N-acetyltransferase [Mycobacteroides sp. CBMA 271]